MNAAIALGLDLSLALGAWEGMLRSQGDLPNQHPPLRGFHESYAQLGWIGLPHDRADFERGSFRVLVQPDA